MINHKNNTIQIDFRKGIENDFDFYYDLKSEKSNIYWGGHKNEPDFDRLKKWYDENILSGKYHFFIIEHDDNKVGAIYYEMKDESFCEYLGLAISEKFQGLGLASQSVMKFFQHIRENHRLCRTIEFFIREDNIVSQKIHEKLGCVKTNKTEERFLESTGKLVKMEYWIYNLIQNHSI